MSDYKSWKYGDRTRVRQRRSRSFLQDAAAGDDAYRLDQWKVSDDQPQSTTLGGDYARQFDTQMGGPAVVNRPEKKKSKNPFAKAFDAVTDVPGNLWEGGKDVAAPALTTGLKVLGAGQKYVGAPIFGPALSEFVDEKGDFDFNLRNLKNFAMEAYNPVNTVGRLGDYATDPVGTYKEGRQGYREFEQSDAPWAVKTAASLASDPLSYIGPGLAKGAGLKVAGKLGGKAGWLAKEALDSGGVGVVAGAGFTAGAEQEYGDRIPGWNKMSPEARSLIAGVLGGVAGGTAQVGAKPLVRMADNGIMALDARIMEPAGVGMGRASAAGMTAEKKPRTVAIRQKDIDAFKLEPPPPDEPMAHHTEAVDEYDAKRELLSMQRDLQTPSQPRIKRLINAGKLTFGKLKEYDQWVKEVQENLTPQEIKDSLAWYKRIRKEFADRMGENNADAWTAGFMTSQVNAGPESGTMNVTRVADRLQGAARTKWNPDTGQMEPIVAGSSNVNERSITNAITRNPSMEGISRKISDFIDSELGKTTRTWMGNDPRGGSPFVADVWMGRDAGFVDEVVAKYVFDTTGIKLTDAEKDFVYTWKKNKKGELVSQGGTFAPTAAQYETVADWGRGITQQLNDANFMDRAWTTEEVQALGWAKIRKLMGDEGGTPDDMFSANTRRIQFELAPGKGSALAARYDWDQLSAAQRRQMTDHVLEKTVNWVQEQLASSSKVVQRFRSVGGWISDDGPTVEPGWGIESFASPETTRDIAEAIGYLSQQSEVLVARPLAGGKAKTFEVFLPDATDHMRGQVYRELARIEPDIFGGFSATPTGLRVADIYGNLGKSGWATKGATKAEQAILDRVQAALEEVDETLGIKTEWDYLNLDTEILGHDWELGEGAPNGYLSRISERGRPALSGTLADPATAALRDSWWDEGWELVGANQGGRPTFLNPAAQLGGADAASYAPHALPGVAPQLETEGALGGMDPTVSRTPPPVQALSQADAALRSAPLEQTGGGLPSTGPMSQTEGALASAPTSSLSPAALESPPLELERTLSEGIGPDEYDWYSAFGADTRGGLGTPPPPALPGEPKPKYKHFGEDESYDLFAAESRDATVRGQAKYLKTLRGRINQAFRKGISPVGQKFDKNMVLDTMVRPFVVGERNRTSNTITHWTTWFRESAQTKMRRAGINMAKGEDGAWRIDGSGPTLEDVVELKTPEGRAYAEQMTPAQQEAVAFIEQGVEMVNKTIETHGGKLPFDENIEGTYFPRKVIGREGEARTSGASSFRRSRTMESLEEGLGKNVEYDNPFDALEAGMKGKLQHAQDAYMVSSLEPLSVKPDKEAGIMPGFGYKHVKDPAFQQHPLAAPMLFPDDIADRINDALKPPSDNIITGFAKGVNAVLTPLRATGDFSGSLQQGMNAWLTNPRMAAEAWSQTVLSLKDPEMYYRAVDKLEEQGPGLNEHIRWGGHYTDPQSVDDYMLPNLAEKMTGGRVKQLPVLGKVAQKSNEHFSRFLNLVRFDMGNEAYMRAQKLGLSGKELDDYMKESWDGINRSTGWSGRKVSNLESIAVFAPKYLSASIEQLYTALTKGGVQGHDARQHLSKLIVTGATLAWTINTARGKETEFDPRSPNFLKIRDVGGLDVSILGTYDTLGRVVAGTVFGTEQGGRVNALERFGWSKMSPAMKLLYEPFIKQSDYLGRPIDMTTPEGALKGIIQQGKSSLPFSAQNLIEEGPTAALVGTTGLSSSPMTATEKRDYAKEGSPGGINLPGLGIGLGHVDTPGRSTEGVAQEMFAGKSYDELTAAEKSQVNEDERVAKHQADADKNTLTRADDRSRATEATIQYRTKMDALSAEFEDGTITGDEFRDQYKILGAELRGSWEALKQSGHKDKVLDGWFALYDIAQTESGRLDHDALEQLQDEYENLHPDVQDRLEKEVGTRDNETLREYRLAKKEAAEYYEIPTYVGLTKEESEHASKILQMAAKMVSFGEAANKNQALAMLMEEDMEGVMLARRAKVANPDRKAFRVDPEHALFNKFYGAGV